MAGKKRRGTKTTRTTRKSATGAKGTTQTKKAKPGGDFQGLSKDLRRLEKGSAADSVHPVPGLPMSPAETKCSNSMSIGDQGSRFPIRASKFPVTSDREFAQNPCEQAQFWMTA